MAGSRKPLIRNFEQFMELLQFHFHLNAEVVYTEF